MQRLTSRRPFALFAFACLSFAVATVSAAGKIKFPSDNPAFVVELPSGWTQARDKNGNLDCDPRDSSDYRFSILILDHVHSEKELKVELPELVKAMGSVGDVKNFKMGDVEGTENENGVRFAEVKGKGEGEGGNFVVVVTGFEPQKGRFYAMVSAGSEEADKKHASDYEGIAASIAPIDSKSKGKESGVKPSEKEENAGLSAGGLPKQYADYLIAANTRSPDGKFAVIYPKMEVCTEARAPGTANRCKDYLVALKPFQILTELDTEWPEFENKNHGGMSATWTKDGSAVLVTLDSKWGPGDIFLYEIKDGKVRRSTNLLSKMRDMLVVDCKKAIPDLADDCSRFVFVVGGIL